MGSFPALAIRQEQPDLLGAYVRMMQVKSLLLGQQISQQDALQQIQERKYRNQQLQIQTQDQQNVLDAQHDPEWDASDMGTATRVLMKHNVSVGAANNVIQGLATLKDTLNTASASDLSTMQKYHAFLDDKFQAARNAPADRQQDIYDKAKRDAWSFFAAEPPSVARSEVLRQISEAPSGYNQTFLDQEHALLRTTQDLSEAALKSAQTSEATAKAGQATAETGKATAETANLPSPAEAKAQRAAALAQTRTTTAKTAEELAQLKRNQQNISQPDVTGFQSPLPVNEYNKRYDAFAKSRGFGQLQTLQGSYSQFQDTLSDLDAGKPMTGAASVVALFNAIGISAEPLAGKGFRINSNTIQEHVGARGLDQAAYQKLLSLKNGDIITPQQVKDYASIASNVYKNAYVAAADEAHRQGLPADFLPQGGGSKLDSTTAEIFARVVLHTNPGLANNPAALKAAIAQAAQKNGWGIQ